MPILVFSTNGKYTTKTTLEEARVALDCANKTVVVTTALTEAQSNISAAWPTDRALRIEKGGSITVATGTSFVFVDGESFYGVLSHIFKGGGDVVFTAQPQKVFAAWYGLDNKDTIGSETTNTPAIQRAVTSAKGGTLQFSGGIIRHNQWTIPHGITVKGVGNDFFGTVLRNVDSASGVRVYATAGYMSPVTISDLMLHGNSDIAYASTSGDLLELATQARIVVDNVYIYNSGRYGVYLSGLVTEVTLRNLFIQCSASDGIYGRRDNVNQINAITIDTCSSSQNVGSGINISALNLNITDGVYQGNDGAGIYLSGVGSVSNSSGSSSINIENNYLEKNKQGNISCLTEYKVAGPILRAISNLTIAKNYLLLSAVDVDAGITASVIFATVAPYVTDTYKGLSMYDNTFSGTLPYIDFGNTVGNTATVKLSLPNGEVFKTVVLNIGYFTLSPKFDVDPIRSGAGFTALEGYYTDELYRDTTNNVIYQYYGQDPTHTTRWNVLTQRVQTGGFAPTVTPHYKGQLYLDTVAVKWYIGKATTASTDWVLVN